MPGSIYPMDISVKAVTDAVERWGGKADRFNEARDIARMVCCGECDGECDAMYLAALRSLLLAEEVE